MKLFGRMSSLLLVAFALVMAFFAPLLAFSQSATRTPYTQTSYFAVDYAQWGIKSQNANTFLFSPIGQCLASASGQQFFPFAINTPVFILDASPALSEVVTPSSVTYTSSQCGFSGAAANNHYSFQIQSGTAGLQEAINALAPGSSAYPAKIVVDRNWYAIANAVPNTSALGILAAAKGNAKAFLQDETTGGITTLIWNGSAYVAGTWANTKPTAAANVAAGTSPTISNTGTSLSTQIILTEGTAPTTGVLFTLTWATTGQFLYAPTSCTVTSNGTNSFTSFISSTAYGSSAVLTVTATSSPTASTAYKFIVNGCK